MVQLELTVIQAEAHGAGYALVRAVSPVSSGAAETSL